MGVFIERCADGKLPEPLDLIHLLFPNNGSVGASNNFACYNLTPLKISFLENILPPSDGSYTREGLIDSTVCFLIACSLLTLLMLIVHYVWSKVDPCFAAISPPHKKWYVIANISKCIFLCIQATSHRYWMGIYQAYYLDQFSNIQNHSPLNFDVTELIQVICLINAHPVSMAGRLDA